MASNSVHFTCNSLVGTNKAGILVPDANGYYEIVVGALNVFNSAGQLYVYEQAKKLFESSSQLMRRVSRGVLRGEYGHPKKLPGMSNDDFARRILTIYEENTCCHHKEIWLDFDRIKDANGKPVIAIMSKVCPSGPNGPALEKQLKNGDENACFSIRSFTDDYWDRGIYTRVLKTIVTWDYVNEPGISHAEKYKSPGLESFDSAEEGFQFSRGEIERCVRTNEGKVANESAIMSVDDLFRNMNWDRSHLNANNKPAYINW